MRGTRVSRASGLTLVALFAGLLAPVAAHAAPAPPVATITSPASGTGVTGVIDIGATGQLDPAAADVALTLSLIVDGGSPGSTVDCSTQPDPTTLCTASFSYNTAGLSAGPHTLQAELTTLAEGFVDSAAVTVIVPGPPAVSIDPVASPVAGAVPVAVTGSTDAASSDLPQSVQLDWGSTLIGTLNCATPLQHSCPLSFDWDTTGVNATHNLTATLTTVDNKSATATQANVAAANPGPQVTLTAPANGGTLRGPVTLTATGTTDPRQRDHPESMRFYLHDTSHPISPVLLCSQTASSCDGSFAWDVTGRTGSDTVLVGFRTTKAKTTTDSAAVTFDSPGPTVAISSPTEGATVSGIVTVNAVGTVDASQADSGATMGLYVDNVLVDTESCPAGRSCPATLTWDGSGVNGTRTLKVVFHTTNDKSASDSNSVRLTTTPPVATISAPANGATVSGPVTIVTNGAINAAQKDTPASMQLLVDGQPTTAAQPCVGTAAAPKACSVPFGWDTTGLSGAHTLQASFRTQKGFSALSAKSTVTIVSPLPVATILTPASNATVHRTATITASGVINATQTDSPASMQLTLDGVALGTAIPCAPAPTSPRACTVSYPWSTTGLTGRHTLAATVVSAKGVVGASTATSVYVYGGTKTVITPAKAQRAGRSVTYTGRVTTLINRLGTPGVKVKIVIKPAVGKSRTLYVLTNAKGYFKVAFKPAVNTTVIATMVGLPYYGTSHTFSKLHVVPTFKCTVGSSVRRNSLDRGSCRVTNLPKTTKVSLQYEFAGHWFTLGTGRAPGPVIPFSFRFAHSGSYHVRVVLSGTSVFAAATGPSLKVAVL